MPDCRREVPVMSWITPSFEVIELSSEVTCYRYHR